MKVKQLIEKLQKCNPKMEVYIQAEVYESDYMIAQSVRKKTLFDNNHPVSDEEEDEDEGYFEAVVIDYE